MVFQLDAFSLLLFRIVMEREREIRAFNPVQYFVIKAEVETTKSKMTKLTQQKVVKNLFLPVSKNQNNY